MDSPNNHVSGPQGKRLIFIPRRESQRRTDQKIFDFNILRTDIVEKEALNDSDIVIAIMGPTGSGKSTFIQTASGNTRETGVGHELRSSTQGVVAYRVTFKGSDTKVVLVDTPGFDSTYMSDHVMLERISKWLSHKKLVLLSGILYMHRISDNRLGRTPLNNIELFKKLCGERAFHKVALVTTMWQEGEDLDLEVVREKELKEDYWSGMIARGSRVVRFMGTRESAWSILSSFMQQASQPIQIQQELVSQSKDFADTIVGQSILAPATRILVKQGGVTSRMAKELADTTKPGVIQALGYTLKELGEQRDNAMAKLLPGSNRPFSTQIRKWIPSDGRQISHFTPEDCRTLLLEIANTEANRKALCMLRDDDAQAVINYFNEELRETDILENEDGRRLFSLFCKFAKSARVFPRSFQLSGVQYDPKVKPKEGGFGDVYKGLHRGSGQAIAIKVIKSWNMETLRLHIKELTLWAHLSHPNILSFYGVFRSPQADGNVCLVSPWMENGNLHDYSNGCSVAERLSLLLDVIKGLLYLHQRDIVHGDLKGLNVLVSNDGKALIADFGVSSTDNTETMMQTVNIDTRPTSASATSVRWTAPERFHADAEPANDDYEEVKRPRKPSDIWSFGCLVYEVMSRRLPYDKYKQDFQVMYAISRRELPERPLGDDRNSNEIPEGSAAWRVITYCWNFDPDQRPTCEKVDEQFTKYFVEDGGDLSDIQTRTSANTAEASSRLRFWEDVKKTSGRKVDFSRVYWLLLETWAAANKSRS